MKHLTTNRSLLTLLTLVGIPVFWGGCVGIGGGDSQPTLYYTLEPAGANDTGRPEGQPPIVVGLEKLGMPNFLDRKELVIRRGRNELRYTSNHLWAEKPGDALPRVISLGITRQSNHAIQVHGLPWPDSVDPEYAIEIDIQAFEGQEFPDAAVRLEISWRIQSMVIEGSLREGRFESAGRDWVQSDYAGLAEGLSIELANAAQQISQDLDELIAVSKS